MNPKMLFIYYNVDRYIFKIFYLVLKIKSGGWRPPISYTLSQLFSVKLYQIKHLRKHILLVWAWKINKIREYCQSWENKQN